MGTLSDKWTKVEVGLDKVMDVIGKQIGLNEISHLNGDELQAIKDSMQLMEDCKDFYEALSERLDDIDEKLDKLLAKC